MHYLSSDVGGTFVDLVLVDPVRGDLHVEKVPSTGHSADGILDGIGRILKAAGIPVDQVGSFVHGFTIATNAWLTRRGAKVAFVVTDGFRDVMEIGTQRRSQLYALTAEKPPPIVPRSQAVEIAERIDAFGDVVDPLTDAEVARAIAALRAMRPDSVAIMLLFSFMNDAHERRLADAIPAALPGVPVYLSSEINPQIEEYVRANTTVAAAYVGPAVDGYVTALEDGLRRIGFSAPLMLMRSDGGVATPDATRRNPATMLLSGPAGGVIAAAALGAAIGVPDIVTFDMGGTSADFSLIADGTARISGERSVNDQTLRLPMLDIETISAGGGSIASVDRAGALHVGPQSAGSIPGPACYGRGGTEPTLTDAAVVLGLIDPDDFAGGRLLPEAAEAVIAAKVGGPLGLTVTEAAWGMIAVANAQMRQAIRALSIERGHDLRRFSLLAFGGAGPIFAALMADDLGIRQVLIPQRPGVFAAFGLLLSDVKHNAQAPYATALEDVVADDLARRLGRLAEGLDAALARDGVPADRRQVRFLADMRYAGQFHDITVPIASPAVGAWWDAGVAADTFHRAHEQGYGHCDRDSPVEIVNVRAEAQGRVDKPSFPMLAPRTAGAPVPVRHRDIVLERGGRHRCPVYLRADLAPGDVLEGPAIVSQSDTTVLILPGQTGTTDDHGVIRIASMERA
ncbi:MAG: hydantoinase/oxoprolinase family protein [Alphaproteobacteria bacterium]